MRGRSDRLADTRDALAGQLQQIDEALQDGAMDPLRHDHLVNLRGLLEQALGDIDAALAEPTAARSPIG